jgi:hypothetical protein
MSDQTNAPSEDQSAENKPAEQAPPEKSRARKPSPKPADALHELLQRARRMIQAVPMAEIDGDLRRIGEQIDHYLTKRG